MPRTYTDPTTKKEYELPTNLYAHARNLSGRWRYKAEGEKHPTDLNNFIAKESRRKFIPAEDAINLAKALNGFEEEEVRKPKHKEKSAWRLLDTFLLTEVSKREEANTHETRCFKEERSYLSNFVDEYFSVAASFNTDQIEDWWHNVGEFADAKFYKSYHAQRRRRHIFILFFHYLQARHDLTLKLPIRESLILKKKPGKTRRRINLPALTKIISMAEADGLHWLARAIKISMCIGWRLGDIHSLKFSDFEDNVLKKEIIKAKMRTENQKYKSDNSSDWFIVDLREQKFLLGIMNEARASRDSEQVLRNKRGAPETVIHRPDGRNCKSKTHPCHISKQELSRYFSKYVDKCGLYDDLDVMERPTFHEVRAFFAHMLKKNGKAVEDIQHVMVHKDKKMTEGYLEDHERNETRLDFEITEEMIMAAGGDINEN